MSGEYARLFAALVLPERVRVELSRWSTGLAAAELDLKPSSAESLHLTLCFLGSIPSSEVAAIGAACDFAARAPAPELKLRRACWLPARRPRVLAVTLEDDSGPLTALQASLSSSLQAGGWYVPERRPFLPHVTVARVRRGARTTGGTRAAGAARATGAPLPEPPGGSFTCTLIALFESRLDRTGAHHEQLHSARLLPPHERSAPDPMAARNRAASLSPRSGARRQS